MKYPVKLEILLIHSVKQTKIAKSVLGKLKGKWPLSSFRKELFGVQQGYHLSSAAWHGHAEGEGNTRTTLLMIHCKMRMNLEVTSKSQSFTPAVRC